MLSGLGPVPLACDILKAAHHGRDSGFYQPAVEAMSPKIVICSVGEKPDTDATDDILCFALVPGLPAWNKLWPLLGAAGVVILVDQLGRDGESGFSRRYGPAGVAPRRQ